MRKTESFSLTINAIEEATLFVQQCLKDCRFPEREAVKAALVAEEAIGSLISHGNRDGKVRVMVRIFLGTVTIDVSLDFQVISPSYGFGDVRYSCRFAPTGSVSEVLLIATPLTTVTSI